MHNTHNITFQLLADTTSGHPVSVPQSLIGHQIIRIWLCDYIS
jgi:hypothetical protein